VGARLVFVALRVRDLEASVRFYRDAIGVPLREAGGVDEETHREYSWTDGAYCTSHCFRRALEVRHAVSSSGSTWTTSTPPMRKRLRRALI